MTVTVLIHWMLLYDLRSYEFISPDGRRESAPPTSNAAVIGSICMHPEYSASAAGITPLKQANYWLLLDR